MMRKLTIYGSMLLQSASLKQHFNNVSCRSAALQYAPRQELYDLFIPFYWGKPDQPYNLLEGGAILAQVKNRGKKASRKDLSNDTIFKLSSEDGSEHPQKRWRTENDKKFLFNHAGAKLLYTLLDLGVDEPGVEVSYSKSKNPEVWAIHCTGHDEGPFNCIKSGELQNLLMISSMLPWDQHKRMTLHFTMTLIYLTMSWTTIG